MSEPDGGASGGPGMGPDRPTLRRQAVTDAIKAYILQNHLSPGDLLPTESALCEELGASRSSIREAIKTLSALDIIEVRHGHGTYVGRLSMGALVEGLVFRAKLSSRDDFNVLGEVVGVRQLLEQGFAPPIIAEFDDELHAELAALVAGMRQRAKRGETFLEQDREFHLTLIRPLRNDLVSQFTAAFWDVQALVTPLLQATARDVRQTVDAHDAIVQAAAAGDETAFVRAVENHYAPVRNQLAAARRRGVAAPRSQIG